MFDTWVIALEITVSFSIGLAVLFLVIKSIKSGGFDDGEKMMQGLLFDNNEDLQDAIEQEEKVKRIKENKRKNIDKQNKENNDI